uniref:Uncharacterized protein n=1 Tax=Opuntia streptacantha TaxID=393608 RepID=A0A7C9AX52_OPUST
MGFGSWFIWLFGGVRGQRESDGFLKAQLLPFKISSSIFCEHYIVGVKCLMGFLRCLCQILLIKLCRRACGYDDFCTCPFCTRMSSPSCRIYITHLITYQKKKPSNVDSAESSGRSK